MTGRLLASRYRLVKPIAKGGMAEVWEGRDEVLARPVAVKVLHRHLADDEAFVERFRREAVAAAKLAHPGIVATFDTGTDGDLAFIVMELVPGRTLSHALAEDIRLEPDVAVQGNLDPAVCLAPWEAVELKALSVLRRAGGRPGHIFNLGHGVLPDTPPENLERLVDLVHVRTEQPPGGSPWEQG